MPRLPVFRTLFLSFGIAASPLASQSMPQPMPTALTFATVPDALEGAIAERVLVEAYRRLGVDIAVRRFPGAEALQMANAGDVDGDLYRIDHIEAVAPNLVQVPVPIAYLEVAAFSLDRNLAVRSWVDLRDRRVGVVRGTLAVSRAIGDLRTREVDTYAELYPLLARGEVDAIVVGTQQLLAVPLISGLGARLHMNGVIDTYMLYHYLHRRHAAIAKELEPILKSMLMNGSVARVRTEVIETVMRRGRP